MLKIYLASIYERRSELIAYAEELKTYGYTISSSWLYSNEEVGDGGIDKNTPLAVSKKWAIIDFEDVLSSDCVISFTEPFGTLTPRGGRHVEFGMAYATDKDCIIVGENENLFHYLPGIIKYNTWKELIENINKFR